MRCCSRGWDGCTATLVRMVGFLKKEVNAVEPLNSPETAHQLLEALADRQPLSRQPVAILSGGGWLLNRHALTMQQLLAMPPEDAASLIISNYQEARSDILWAAPGSGSRILSALGAKVKFNPHGPAETLEPLIKTEADLDAIDRSRIDQETQLAGIREITRSIAQKAAGAYYVAAGMWGPLTMAGLLCGIEALSRFMYRNKALAHSIIDFTADLYLYFMAGYRAAGVDLLWMAEPTASGDMISLRIFEEFALPALQKVYDAIARDYRTAPTAAGTGGRVLTGLHICGNTQDRLHRIPTAGLDILSVDYKVSLKNARAILEDRIILAGNVNPVDICYESPHLVAEESLRCIADAQGGAFLLMPGCDVPPATPMANIQAMANAASGSL